MSQNYTPEFKKKIVRLHEEGHTYKSITADRLKQDFTAKDPNQK